MAEMGSPEILPAEGGLFSADAFAPLEISPRDSGIFSGPSFDHEPLPSPGRLLPSAPVVPTRQDSHPQSAATPPPSSGQILTGGAEAGLLSDGSVLRARAAHTVGETRVSSRVAQRGPTVVVIGGELEAHTVWRRGGNTALAQDWLQV
jgi:hypothetical protein